MWLTAPLVPVTVSVTAPAGVAAEVETVRVDEPEPAMDAGLNLPVAPLGKPVTLSDTVPVNPFTAVTETAYVVLPPADTVCDAGDTATEKSGVRTLTAKVTVALWLALPLWPVIVRM